MLKNNDFIEEFKKSLSATIKSIGKNEKIEINYVKDNPSVVGNTINITEPNIENIKNNLTYLRAEADSLALEFRLHSKEIHENFEVPVVKVEDNISVMKDEKGVPFFTSRSFNSTIERLLDNFDQVFICSNSGNAKIGLMALSEFTPGFVLLAGLRKTKKIDIQNLKTKQPIDLLLYG